MSYSIGVTEQNRDLAREAILAKFDGLVIASQPSHAIDREAVVTNLNAALALLRDDADKDVVISLNGYLAWEGEPQAGSLTAVGITCNVALTSRKA